jgi:hypothetical protein
MFGMLYSNHEFNKTKQSLRKGLDPVWILRIKFHSNNHNLDIN